MKAKLFDPRGVFMREIDLGFAPPAVLTVRPTKATGEGKSADMIFVKFELISIQGETASYRAVG